MKLSKPSIERNIDAIQKEQLKVNFNNLDSSALKLGVKISRQALFQPEDIALTPYMMNALHELDHIDDLKVGDPTTKMEMYLEKETEKLLLKYCGPQTTDYDPK